MDTPRHRHTSVVASEPRWQALELFIAALILPLVAQAGLPPEYIGSAACAACHEEEFRLWQGSHHDHAMEEATPTTVLGDFDDAEITAHGVTSRFQRKGARYFVRTDGPEGALQEYAVRYTFGWYPLQQYLVEMPGGRLQSLGLAWDSRPEAEGGQRWFHLYPDEDMDYRHPLHWTGREQTWNYQCAECHSTHLRRNYDLESDIYRTTWSEIDVACEACHGPGSAHAAWAENAAAGGEAQTDPDRGLAVILGDRDAGVWTVDAASGRPARSPPRRNGSQLEVCARCHARRGSIWAQYEHGAPLGDSHRLALLEDHLYFPDGQIKDEVFVYGSFLQSAMHRAGVTCSDCHEPHGLTLRAEGNALCGRCHAPARYDTPGHHHHEPGGSGAACTACHMPQRTYMVIDERADHSLRIPRPDLSERLGTPDACTGCHADREAAWAADAVASWYPDSAHRKPHFGVALSAAATGGRDAGKLLARLATDPTQPGIARASALERLRAHAEAGHLSAVGELAGDDDPLIRAAAVRFLEVADVRTRVDLAWERLEDPVRAVRLEAARLLAPLLQQQLPDRFRAQLTRAVEEYAQSQYANAERPEAHLNLGLVALSVGDAPQARESYRTAIRLDPAFAPAYANLADLYRLQGRDADGEALLRAGLEATDRDPSLAHALGLLLVREGRLEEATGFLREAAETAIEQPRYALVYGLALEKAGRTAEAVEVLGRARARHPRDRDLRLALDDLRRDTAAELPQRP